MTSTSIVLHDGKVLTAPTVTIIVVTYNHETFIDECLRSCVLQAQTFPNLEIVVADDGSRDDARELIRRWAHEYPELIFPILAEKNTGIASNFNRGLDAARGELIAWLGGDDIMLPNKISRQVELLALHPEATGCYHDAEVFAWPSGQTLGLFSELYAGKAAQAAYVDAARMLDPRYQMLPSTVMVRRSCLPKAFDTRLRFHNDYLFDFETIARGGPYIRLEGVLTRYRKHEKSIGLDPTTRATMLEENLMVAAIAETRFPTLARRINRRAIYYLSLEAIRSRVDGDPQRARAICHAIFTRGAWLRALSIFLAGGMLVLLADPQYRRLAVKLRSILG